MLKIQESMLKEYVMLSNREFSLIALFDMSSILITCH